MSVKSKDTRLLVVASFCLSTFSRRLVGRVGKTCTSSSFIFAVYVICDLMIPSFSGSFIQNKGSIQTDHYLVLIRNLISRCLRLLQRLGVFAAHFQLSSILSRVDGVINSEGHELVCYFLLSVKLIIRSFRS